jgi:hypothetical protein
MILLYKLYQNNQTENGHIKWPGWLRHKKAQYTSITHGNIIQPSKQRKCKDRPNRHPAYHVRHWNKYWKTKPKPNLDHHDPSKGKPRLRTKSVSGLSVGQVKGDGSRESLKYTAQARTLDLRLVCCKGTAFNTAQYNARCASRSRDLEGDVDYSMSYFSDTYCSKVAHCQTGAASVFFYRHKKELQWGML